MDLLQEIQELNQAVFRVSDKVVKEGEKPKKSINSHNLVFYKFMKEATNLKSSFESL